MAAAPVARGTVRFIMRLHSGAVPGAVTMADMSFQGNGAGLGLRALSVLIGLFLILMAMDKVRAGWLIDSAPLLEQLQGWHGVLVGIVQQSPDGGLLAGLADRWRGFTFGKSVWYLEAICIPYAPVFSRIVPVAEFAAGAALVVGFSVRLTAGLALLMVLNFHFAMGIIFTFDYLMNAYGPPIVGSLLALTMGGRALPFSLR